MRGEAPILPAIVLLFLSSFSTLSYGQCKKGNVISLEGWHQSVSCLEEPLLIPPVVIGVEIASAELSYTEEYFKIGCINRGFKGYFSPSRWSVDQNIGDGGVDVTGAPNSVLVEGANSASVVLSAGSFVSYNFVIPAIGYVTFDWSYIGGSNLINKSFSITVNGEKAEELQEEHQRGQFSSSLLEAGDKIQINAFTKGDGFEIRMANFEFVSNAIGVYERLWSVDAPDCTPASFRQYVSVKKPDFTKLVFPPDFDGYNHRAVEHSSGYEPDWTGYPVFDEDGILSTTLDQHPISDLKGGALLKWEDEYLNENGICFIYRKWDVTDYCGSNRITHTQLIRLNQDCPDSPDKLSGKTTSAPRISLPEEIAPSTEEQALMIEFDERLINSTLKPEDFTAW